jgi:hypothetical protein
LLVTFGTYSIVDTGQTLTYNNTSEISAPAPGEAFYGQDAQFDGNQAISPAIPSAPTD